MKVTQKQIKDEAIRLLGKGDLFWFGEGRDGEDHVAIVRLAIDKRVRSELRGYGCSRAAARKVLYFTLCALAPIREHGDVAGNRALRETSTLA